MTQIPVIMSQPKGYLLSETFLIGLPMILEILRVLTTKSKCLMFRHEFESTCGLKF